ncbi:hypothetical protein, partial [Klebsiella pneumoniae]|uniref:hypothetical protein n=1 Tax=Klebsiella pneumoniae TaxID=573 RepID=UPI00300965E5
AVYPADLQSFFALSMRIILLMVIYFFLPGSVSLAILRSGLPASCSACIAGKEIVDGHHTLWARVRMSSFL